VSAPTKRSRAMATSLCSETWHDQSPFQWSEMLTTRDIGASLSFACNDSRTCAWAKARFIASRSCSARPTNMYSPPRGGNAATHVRPPESPFPVWLLRCRGGPLTKSLETGSVCSATTEEPGPTLVPESTMPPERSDSVGSTRRARTRASSARLPSGSDGTSHGSGRRFNENSSTCTGPETCPGRGPGNTGSVGTPTPTPNPTNRPERERGTIVRQAAAAPANMWRRRHVDVSGLDDLSFGCRSSSALALVDARSM
jgi:hypothetical protein